MRPFLFLLSLAGVTLAQPASYFPLDSGNTWVYRASSNGTVMTRTIEVTGARTVNGVQYSVVNGLFGSEALLRQDSSGRLLVYDAESKQDRLWVPLAADTGTVFSPEADSCTGPGTVTSHTYVYDGPIGHFDTAIQIDYGPGKCADAGVTRDVFLPWVGLLRRIETSIAGPRTWDLVYASVGGNLFANASGVEFTLTLDQPSYKPADTMLARFAVRNWRSDKPVTLMFSSGQEFDLVLYNDKGGEVYRWALGKLFAQYVHSIVVSKEKDWVVDVPLANVNGGLGLAAGKYVAEAYLTNVSQSSQREYMAHVSFTIE